MRRDSAAATGGWGGTGWCNVFQPAVGAVLCSVHIVLCPALCILCCPALCILCCVRPCSYCVVSGPVHVVLCPALCILCCVPPCAYCAVSRPVHVVLCPALCILCCVPPCARCVVTKSTLPAFLTYGSACSASHLLCTAAAFFPVHLAHVF
jgi:hypothetical protein